jgi:rhamnosyltransferase subunit B
LPPVRRLYSHWLRSPQQVIGLFPDWFAAPQPDWPRQARLAGFVRVLPQHEGASLRADLLEFLAQGPPPVVFTAGTGMLHGAHFFLESIQACALSGQRGIVVTPYRQQLPQTLPTNIHYCEHAAFAELFPRASAVVHHGGIGTIAEALAAGAPQLVHPSAHDQPDNAARLEMLGVSHTIKPQAYQAATVAKYLSELVASPEIKQRSKQYAQRINFGAALAQVCDLVEGRPCGND